MDSISNSDLNRSKLLNAIADKMVCLTHELNRYDYIQRDYKAMLHRRTNEDLFDIMNSLNNIIAVRARLIMVGVKTDFEFFVNRTDRKFIIILGSVENTSNTVVTLNLGNFNSGNIRLNQILLPYKDDYTVRYDLRNLNFKVQHIKTLMVICEQIKESVIFSKPCPYDYDSATLNRMVEVFSQCDLECRKKYSNDTDYHFENHGFQILVSLKDLIIIKDNKDNRFRTDKSLEKIDNRIQDYVYGLRNECDEPNGFYGIKGYGYEYIMDKAFRILESDKIVKNQRIMLCNELRDAYKYYFHKHNPKKPK